MKIYSALWCLGCVFSSTGLPELPNAILEEDDYSRIAVIPDTHGDLEAAIYSVWLAYLRLVPEYRLKSDKDDFYVKMNDAVLYWGTLTTEQVTAKAKLPEKYLNVWHPDIQRIALIQLGDLVDRGEKSRECIDLFEIIEPMLGWKVLRLYGNHDVWTIMSNPGVETSERGYINPKDLKSFVTDKKAALNEGSNQKYRIPKFRPGGEYYQKYIQSYLGMAKWTGRKGMRTLFVHAGISFDWFKYVFEKTTGSLKQVSDRSTMSDPNWINEFNSALRDFIDLSHYLSGDKRENMHNLLSINGGYEVEDSQHPQSFLWTRFVAYQKQGEEKACEWVMEALTTFNVDRVIVGHSPPRDDVKENQEVISLCQGTFLRADVGMSRWMDGGDYYQPTVLILDAESQDDAVFIDAYYQQRKNYVKTMHPVLRIKVEKRGFPSIRTSDHGACIVIPDTQGDYDWVLKSLWVAFTQVVIGGSHFGEQPFYDILHTAVNYWKEPSKVPTDSPEEHLKNSAIHVGGGISVIRLGEYAPNGQGNLDIEALFKVIPLILGWTVTGFSGPEELQQSSFTRANALFVHDLFKLAELMPSRMSGMSRALNAISDSRYISPTVSGSIRTVRYQILYSLRCSNAQKAIKHFGVSRIVIAELPNSSSVGGDSAPKSDCEDKLAIVPQAPCALVMRSGDPANEKWTLTGYHMNARKSIIGITIP